ncbi:MAG: HAD family hydrolase [bacterium]|nr:HAD family hydrolase [bacterium]
MKYKLLALDIDGTITTDNSHTPSLKVLEALQKAAEKLTIVFVTARSENYFKEFLKNIDIPHGYHVVENGSKVLNPDGTNAYELHIPDPEIQEILNVTEPYFLETGFLSDHNWDDDGDINEFDGIISGLSFTCTSHKQAGLLEGAVKSLPHKYALYVGQHWSNPEWYAALLFHKDATKGNGMAYVQDKLNISVEETIAVGDGATDIDMFAVAGLKIAMENGEQSLKDAADFICPTIKDDGLATAIKKYILS